LTTAKEDVRQLLDTLPDDVSYDEIQYQIYVRHRIAEGLRTADEGRVLSQQELERRMEGWRTS
jgi:predicted transcriptional regulator